MSTHHPSSLSKVSIVIGFLGIVVLVLLLMDAIGVASQVVQEQSVTVQEKSQSEHQKKLIGNIPIHVPVKMKVKNLDSTNWAHDLEIEITNKSEKPIYFLHVAVVLPEIKGPSGNPLGFWLSYGRAKLLNFSTPLESTDVPIKPGETCTLKIPESSANGWETLKKKEGQPEPTKIRVELQGVNFGDGTGFDDASGHPVNIHKKINLNKSCDPPPLRGPEKSLNAFAFLPAKLTLPVKFFVTEPTARKDPAAPDVCCGNVSNCNFVRSDFYTCQRVCDPQNELAYLPERGLHRSEWKLQKTFSERFCMLLRRGAYLLYVLYSLSMLRFMRTRGRYGVVV